MREAPSFRLNASGVAEISAHLAACDSSFIPNLSARVRLDQYAAKLASLATRFEAWDGGELAALVAIYCNDPAGRTAFVTSVSVAPRWQGRGLAKKLLAQAAEYAAARGFARLELKVACANAPALRLYAGLGFGQVDRRGEEWMMRLPLAAAPRGA
jgi:ribosomal protein S18 acetylase RimI-like enzyme